MSKAECYCRMVWYWSKRFWEWIDPNKVMAFFAFVGAGLAYLAWDTAQDQLTNSSRAWLAPGGISFEKLPTRDDYSIVRLQYKNTGNQPATKFARKVAMFAVKSGDIHKIEILEREILRLMEGQSCENFPENKTGSVIHAGDERTLRLEIPPKVVNAIIDVKNFLVVAGYFSYETFDETRHSCFCRFFDFTADPSDPSKWSSAVCDVPEYAD